MAASGALLGPILNAVCMASGRSPGGVPCGNGAWLTVHPAGKFISGDALCAGSAAITSSAPAASANFPDWAISYSYECASNAAYRRREQYDRPEFISGITSWPPAFPSYRRPPAK
jgi:hypothetical protein